jgi:hypothetical protein
MPSLPTVYFVKRTIDNRRSQPANQHVRRQLTNFSEKILVSARRKWVLGCPSLPHCQLATGE